MRVCILFLFLLISSTVFAQEKSDPFIGGIEFGIGYGSIIDFDLDNNNFSTDYLLERLLWLPFKIGMVTAKYFNPNEYLELGLIFARRSSSFVYYHDYGSNGTYSTGMPTICLYSIDFPIKYYMYVGHVFKKQMWAYGGLIPSWIIISEVASVDSSIPEEFIRDASLSLCGGLCYEIKKSRLKLHAGLTVTSIVNSDFEDIPEDERNYGSRIYPYELMFCYARMFK